MSISNWLTHVVVKTFPRRRLYSLFIIGFFTPLSCLADYSQHPLAQEFIDKLVKEHQFAKEYVVQVLSQAEKKQAILDAMSRPAEKTKEWFEYREIFLGETRINQGVQFW